MATTSIDKVAYAVTNYSASSNAAFVPYTSVSRPTTSCSSDCKGDCSNRREGSKTWTLGIIACAESFADIKEASKGKNVKGVLWKRSAPSLCTAVSDFVREQDEDVFGCFAREDLQVAPGACPFGCGSLLCARTLSKWLESTRHNGIVVFILWLHHQRPITYVTRLRC